jgi:hypothetical protein
MTASALVKNPDLKCMAKIRRATACGSRSKSTAKLSGLPRYLCVRSNTPVVPPVEFDL